MTAVLRTGISTGERRPGWGGARQYGDVVHSARRHSLGSQAAMSGQPSISSMCGSNVVTIGSPPLSGTPT